MSWLGFALAGAFANAIAGTLAKAGLAITSVVVAVATTIFTLARGDALNLVTLDRRTWLVLVIAGVATAGAYLLYFRALGAGDSARVQPIDRLSRSCSPSSSRCCFSARSRTSASSSVRH